MWDKIFAFWKNHFIIATLLSWIIPIVLATLLKEPVVYFINKYLNNKTISIEVVSANNGSRYDIQNYANSEDIGNFNYKQDDPLISNYWIFKLNMKNKGTSIKDNLKFKIALEKVPCKIIDLKSKIVRPQNKDIYISNSISDLEWSLEEYNDSKYLGIITMEKQPREIIGKNIYRSRLKHVGYGRVNNELIKENYFVVEGKPSKQEQMYYYAVENVQFDGQRSPLSPPMHIVASAAFRPFYKNMFIIRINDGTPNSRKNIFNSLEEAINSKESGKIFLVGKERSEITNMTEYLKLSNNNNKIIFLGDIKNLNGKVDINVPSGLDENAEINFYLLCKTLPGDKPNINIKLEGQPSISLITDDSAIKNKKNMFTDNITNEGRYIDERKYNLTPAIVTSYYGEQSIYLAWEFIGDVKWKGVRIFRSDDNRQSDNNIVGEDIFEGPCGKRKFNYRFNSEKWENDKVKDIESKNILLTDEPPRRNPKETKGEINNKRISAPGPISIIDDNVDIGKDMYYYEDKKVVTGKPYNYIIYIYDENNVYSYPIKVSAVLDKTSYSPYCYPIEQ